MPKISVIVPVYKVEQYLNKCVDSVLQQTFEDFELILVDDGSPDECPRICDEYQEKDGRVCVIHKKNGGLSSARNTGLQKATGEYVFFLDSDDYLSSNALEKLFCMIEENEADIALCNFLMVNEDGTPLYEKKESPIKDEVISGEEAIHKIHENKGFYYVIAWNKLYKRNLFQQVSYELNKVHEDEFIIHKIYHQCKKIVCTKENLYYYVQRTDSIMGNGISIDKLDGFEALLKRALFLVKSSDPVLMDAYRLLRSQLWIIPWKVCDKFGYDNQEVNCRMKKLRRVSVKYVPYLLLDESRIFKERIALCILLFSPKLYGAIFKK